ncbi:hypothetical protein CDL12_17673 [Handroanthus impetiginosus]|uniref:GBF-interacting protein 1 N-terminal domain-containing protein n=1 Tax=Handroanthus impetiginosus TaxID=429701 RepID=A0A2G9GWU0_9LAMI|nr:hypothetical protein CDL12_17673 [Handroanthus impetiginosus]
MSGVSRVSISDSLRRTIQNIKEITGKHSDDDIYAMLKECNMDPNETAQKLFYLDTFHEVKRKRDRKKVSVNNGALEEYRWIPPMQRRGTRSGNYSSYSSEDAVGGRQLNARQENGYSKPVGRASKSEQVPQKERKRVPGAATSTVPANASTGICNRSTRHESIPQSMERNIRDLIKDAKMENGNQRKSLPSLRPVAVKQLPTLDPGPTPTPTPTNTITVATRARIEGVSFKSKSSNLGNSVGSPCLSGLYASASDPILVPELNPRNPGTVGIIKCETGNQRNTAEISASLLANSRTNTVENVTTGQEVSESGDLTSYTKPIEHQGVEKIQLAESSRPPSSTSHHTAAAKGNQATCSVRQVNGPSKEMVSEAAVAAQEANRHSLPTMENCSTEKSTSEVDIRLHKLHISPRQSVIFPNHLQVPEAFKNALTFGTLDAALGQMNKDSNPRDASGSTNIESSKEPSLTPQSSSPTSGRSDYPDQSLSPPHVLGNLTSSQENISSGAALRYDQSKQELLHPVGRSHNPLLPPMPDYDLSLLTPVSGSRLVQIEGLEPQVGNPPVPSTAGSTSTVTHPRGVAQSSITVLPEIFPFIRQPYPPNYIPYSPYLSQLYMPPQNAHQLLSHSGFPQQPSTGNIYMPPTAAAAAAGVKFPVIPVYKPGNVAGNLTHFGISSGYVPYGASGLGYGFSATLPPGTSSNDDLSGSELKEKNIYSTIKQNEDLHVLSAASGRDISALQANMFYNFPQGQAVAFSPAQVGQNSFPGIYHPTQSMSSPSLVQSLQQSQPTGGTIESIVPPLSSYPQPQLQSQPQLRPLPQQQYGQMNWNKKFLNRENI